MALFRFINFGLILNFIISLSLLTFMSCGTDLEDKSDEIIRLWYLERTAKSDDCKQDTEQLLELVLAKFQLNLKQFDRWASQNLGLLSEIEFNYAKRFCPTLKRNELRYQEEDTSIGTYLVFALIPLLIIIGISLAVYNRIKDEDNEDSV